MKLLIKEIRIKKGFTYRELAKLSKCSKSYIWELENKKNINPSFIKMMSIAKALCVSMEDLVDIKP